MFKKESKLFAVKKKTSGRPNLTSNHEEIDISIGPIEVDKAFRVKDNQRLIRRQLRCDGPFIVFAGGLEESNGIFTLLRAFRLLVNKKGTSKDIQLLVACCGQENNDEQTQSSIERKLKNALKGIEERVRFFKSLSNERLSTLFNVATVTVIPFNKDSIELLAIEAQACGSPVIATDSGDLKSIVKNGETGLFVEENDPVDLSLAIEALVGNELLAKRMRKRAAQRAMQIILKEALK